MTSTPTKLFKTLFVADRQHLNAASRHMLTGGQRQQQGIIKCALNDL